jgi:hypothetical protein
MEHDGLGLESESRVLREIKELIAKHGREWAGRVAELATGFDYEFGLVSGIVITGEAFIRHNEELVAAAPILHMAVRAPVDLAALAATPALRQVSSLAVEPGPWISDEAVVRFAASPYVRRLRAVDFINGQVTEAGLRALATSPNLHDVVYIELTGNPCEETGPRGVHGQVIMDRYYHVGDAGRPYLAEAYDKAMSTYSVMTIDNWPPDSMRLAYVE